MQFLDEVALPSSEIPPKKRLSLIVTPCRCKHQEAARCRFPGLKGLLASEISVKNPVFSGRELQSRQGVAFENRPRKTVQNLRSFSNVSLCDF